MNLADFGIIKLTPVKNAHPVAVVFTTIVNTASVVLGIGVAAYAVGLGLKLGMGC